MNWESIWRENWREIYLYIFYRVQDKQDAEDLTQDTFIRAIKAQHVIKKMKLI